MPSYRITRLGDLDVDGFSECDIAFADDTTLVAAIRTTASYLKVARYRLESGGGISADGEAQTQQVGRVSLALAIPERWFTVTTKIAGGTNLLVSEWRPVVHDEDAEGPLASVTAITTFPTKFKLPPNTGPVPPGTLATGPEGYFVATAHRNSANQMSVTGWMSGGSSLDELATGVAPGRYMEVKILPNTLLFDDGKIHSALVITAGTVDGKLRLASWRITLGSEAPRVVELLSETTTDIAVTELSVRLMDRADGKYLATAVISDGKLSVITWKVLASGGFTRSLTATAGAATGIDCVHLRRGDIAVGCKDSENKLRIIYWRFPFETTGSQEVIRMGTAMAGVVTAGVQLAHTSATAARPGNTVAACRTESGKWKLIRFRLDVGD
jgi:hypothetical protein